MGSAFNKGPLQNGIKPKGFFSESKERLEKGIIEGRGGLTYNPNWAIENQKRKKEH